MCSAAFVLHLSELTTSQRARRAKQPRFQPGFSEQNAKLISDTLRRLDYHGPVALGWDDTDLEKAVAIWQESEETWQVLGTTDGPIRVASVDEIDHALDGLQLNKTAEKV